MTDEELHAALRASGASPADTDTYACSIRERISQLPTSGRRRQVDAIGQDEAMPGLILNLVRPYRRGLLLVLAAMLVKPS